MCSSAVLQLLPYKWCNSYLSLLQHDRVFINEVKIMKLSDLPSFPANGWWRRFGQPRRPPRPQIRRQPDGGGDGEGGGR